MTTHQRPFFELKFHRNAWSAAAPPGPAWELTTLPRPSSWIYRGLLLRGEREKMGKRREMTKTGRKGKEEGRKGG